MNRLQVQDGCFLHPDTYEPLRFVEVVITNKGSLSRSYYDKEGTLNCWSYDCDFPDSNVAANKRQADRCIDCVQSIQRGGFAKGTPCRFFTVIQVVFLGMKRVYELRVNALSLFAKDGTDLNLYKYIEYLEDNQEKVEDVITEIYLGDSYGTHKMYFKPVRPLTKEELVNVNQLIEADQSNPFKEQYMASKSHIIKGVTALYPRINQPYHWSDKQNKSIPCDSTEDGASYDLGFEMSKAQAKELYSLMDEAYKAAREDSWPKKLEMRFKEQDGGTYVGKASLKAAYNGRPTSIPEQFDSKNKRLDSDFMLTTGSTVNIAVELFPYKINGGGVALRLRGVQVKKYVPYKPASPFAEEDGFSVDEKSGSPFASDDSEGGFEAEDTPKAKPEADPFDEEDEVKEPVKRKNKKEDISDDDDAIADIIDVWGDDDD